MLAPGPEGSATGPEPMERNEEERGANEARIAAERVHRQMTQEAKHLAARRRDWAPEGIGESMYMYKLWILGWKGNYSMGSKLNRRSQVEDELEIPMGDKGGLGNSVNSTVVGDDEGKVHHSCDGEPVGNMGNIDGIEYSYKGHKPKIEDMSHRKHRGGRTSNKCFL